MLKTGNLTTADLIFSRQGVQQDSILIGMGTILAALCAQIEIPLYPVPITGQTFGVLLIGALLGANRGAMSMLGYLALGAAGLPVFAGGATGLTAFMGPTAGYLVGFVVAAYLVGFLSERGWDKHFPSAVLSMVLGTMVILLCGVIGLSGFVGWDQVLQLGVYPFLIGAGIKIGLAAAILPQARRFVS